MADGAGDVAAEAERLLACADAPTELAAPSPADDVADEDVVVEAQGLLACADAFEEPVAPPPVDGADNEDAWAAAAQAGSPCVSSTRAASSEESLAACAVASMPAAPFAASASEVDEAAAGAAFDALTEDEPRPEPPPGPVGPEESAATAEAGDAAEEVEVDATPCLADAAPAPVEGGLPTALVVEVGSGWNDVCSVWGAAGGRSAGDALQCVGGAWCEEAPKELPARQRYRDRGEGLSVQQRLAQLEFSSSDEDDDDDGAGPAVGVPAGGPPGGRAGAGVGVSGAVTVEACVPFGPPGDDDSCRVDELQAF